VEEKHGKKRWFVLNNNFMCYYKDSKNLKHPAGVIDFSKARFGKTPYEVHKKKNCFEVVTPQRTYYMCATDEKEVDEWLECIEKTKTNYQHDLKSRKTFNDVENINVTYIPKTLQKNSSISEKL
jgi:hypothetical protein